MGRRKSGALQIRVRLHSAKRSRWVRPACFLKIFVPDFPVQVGMMDRLTPHEDIPMRYVPVTRTSLQTVGQRHRWPGLRKTQPRTETPDGEGGNSLLSSVRIGRTDGTEQEQEENRPRLEGSIAQTNWPNRSKYPTTSKSFSRCSIDEIRAIDTRAQDDEGSQGGAEAADQRREDCSLIWIRHVAYGGHPKTQYTAC